jgi:hypothetical protein
MLDDMNRTGYERTSAGGALIVALLIGGCASKTKTSTPPDPSHDKAPTAPISNTDACATRMQDMCGGLLLYYQLKNRLPESLDEIKNFPGEEGVPSFNCPVSKQPYVYMPNGIFLPEKNARVIVYDAAPSHSNMRWAISIDEPQPGQPLVTKVIALPETFFLLRR